TMTNDMGDAIAALIEIQRKVMKTTDQSNTDLYNSTKLILTTTSGIALLVALIAALWITLGINNGMRKITTVANAVAIGDLN
ncbi:methyl-accepting chemotaxis protein, partial [Rhizobium leguminosarum]